MDKLKESINLSDEIIRNIELSEISIEDIFLKSLRFSKLINDTDWEKWLNFEISWYPLNTDWNWLPENFQLADKFTSRKFTVWGQSYYFTETISELISNYETYKLELPASIDPNISVSSSNPSQYVFPWLWNSQRRILLSVKLPKNWTRNILTKKENYECNLANFAGAILRVVWILKLL